LRAAVDIGLEAGEEEAALLVGDVRARCEEHDGEGKEDVVDHVKEIMGADAPRAAVVRALVVLRDAKGRLDTFDVFHPPGAEAEAEAEAKPPVDEDVIDDDPWAENDEDVDMPPVLDDPWAEDEEPVPSAPSTSAASAPPTPIATVPPIDAATFVLQPLVLSALHFATAAHLPALRITCQRHAAELWPYRLALIDAVPAWVSPGEEDLLPLLLSEGEEGEGPWPRGAVVPPKDDGPESPEALLSAIAPQFGIASLYPAATTPDLFPARADAPLSKEAITEWYTAHVLALDDLGLLDAQLAWVQHGTAFGVTGLDAIGEELSLLSRLIYDASLLPQQLGQWSLRTWRDASEDEIVQAYLANTTADTIVDDLRRLVLPYLYVLESRAERAGAADPALVSRMLHGVILDQPLHLALPCFEASKATLPAPARLVKDDQTVARLALAVLYGSDAHDAWATMSAIFECLPVWDVSGGDVDTDREATETTLDSIAAFVRPASASAGPGPHSARDLFVFFHPLPFASLSRALDILDVHLESGEILARYSVRVVLRTLLQSARDRAEQVTLAEHMVRRSTARADERRWVQLWEDMCRLQGGSDALLRGAFGMLSKHDMMRIFLGGLLASGGESSESTGGSFTVY
jgi:hypothetical protein